MKNYRSYVGSLSETNGRTVEGYAIRFNEESQNLGFYETIERGALTQETINNSDIFAKLNHRDDAILARSRYGEGSLFLELREDGLFYRFEAPNTQYGDELLEHIKRGEISTSSFAFCLDDTDANAQRWYKDTNGVLRRTIMKIDELFDVSPTFEGAYLTTSCSARSIESIKEEIAEISDKIDSETRDNGIPQNDSETLDKPIEEERQKTEIIADEETNTIDTESEEREINKLEPNTVENEITETVQTEERETNNSTQNAVETKNTNTKIKMNKEFRLLDAIRNVVENRNQDAVSEAVINAGKEEMRKSGLSGAGQIQLPVAELRDAITVADTHDDVIPTDLYDVLGPLRAKNVLVQAGAKLMTGLVGDVQVPLLKPGSVLWEAETSEASDAGYVFDNVKLSPKRLSAVVIFSKQFLAQDAKDCEALIRQDLVNAINAKLEATILGSAAGSTTQPEGIFYTTGTTPSVKTYADIADMEASIEDANVFGECKYIMSNKAKAVYRTTVKGNNATGMIMENNAIDGTPVLNTSHVANKLVAYGDWSNLAIGQWSAIDLVIDPYTLASSGQVRLVVNAFFDAKILRPEAFAIGKAE